MYLSRYHQPIAFIVPQTVVILANRELSGGLVNWLRVKRRNHRYYLVMPHAVTLILGDFFSAVSIDLNVCINLCAPSCKMSTSSKLMPVYVKNK